MSRPNVSCLYFRVTYFPCLIHQKFIDYLEWKQHCQFYCYHAQKAYNLVEKLAKCIKCLADKTGQPINVLTEINELVQTRRSPGGQKGEIRIRTSWAVKAS